MFGRSGKSQSELVLSLQNRVAELEREVQQLRRHHLRLAELTDVVQELLIPMAGRDQDKIDAAIARFNQSLG